MARWSGADIPIPILEEAVESIKSETGVSFSWLELYDRFQFLEQHFHAFKLVRHTHDVYWDMQSNTVSLLKTRPRHGIGPSSPCGEASESDSSPLAENLTSTRRKSFPEAYE
ncbi:hypothetical protein SASPL_135342 [Salvia splendens]|uniref:Uncharacterized protein n=1 Tax=Salvia splendens TaxID=180675 RepID=A0A8X8WWC6_SALSN|nr:hypothetical protein SASPL_135342 [Salvia splendens]